MSSSDPIRISPGDVVDDFEIVDVIATGGSSTTFLARHRTLGREVSLKFVHPAVFSGDRGALDAAHADAVRVAGLEHPNIAPVYTAGDHAGGLYVASALPKGRTLADLGTAVAITPHATAGVLADIASALEEAHARGVVHRDLRPDCITVDRWGHGILRDFGVTRESGRTGLLTRAEVLEAMRYTAPELVLGKPATPASDVYGLAAVAVWCLTGAPPYRDRAAAEYVVFRARALPPELTLPDGTAATGLNRLLRAGMALEPSARPSSLEFAGALRDEVAELPAAIRDAGAPLFAVETGSVDPPLSPPRASRPRLSEPTRVEHRRPQASRAPGTESSVPWATYGACALAALTLGASGLLVGRARAPQAPQPVTVGNFTIAAGDTWRRDDRTATPRPGQVRLTSAGGLSATVGETREARLPGDPIPADLLPTAGARPRPVSSGGVQLVRYTAADALVIARPTSKGTVYAICSKRTAVGRCAALMVHADGPGRDLPVAPAKQIAAALAKATRQLGVQSGIASGLFAGEDAEHAQAAAQMKTALGEAAALLRVRGADPGTTAELGRLRQALAGQAMAFGEIGEAIDRESPLAFDAAGEAVQAGRRQMTTSLAAFGRARYPVRP